VAPSSVAQVIRENQVVVVVGETGSGKVGAFAAPCVQGVAMQL